MTIPTTLGEIMPKIVFILKKIFSGLNKTTKKSLYFSFLLFALVIGLRIFSPIFFAWLISDLQNIQENLFWAIFIYAGLFFLIRFFEDLRLALYTVFEQEIQRNILLKTIDKFFNVPFSSEKYSSPSENSIAIEKGMGGIRDIIYSFLFNLAPSSIEFIIMLIIIAWKINLTIALLIGIILSLFIYVTAHLSNKIKSQQEQWYKLYFTNYKILSEGLKSYETIRSFSQINWLKNRYDTALKSFIKKVLLSMRTNVLLGFCQGILLTILILTTLNITLSLTLPVAEKISIFVLVNGLLLQVINPLLNFAGYYRIFMHGIASAKKLFELLNEPQYPVKLNHQPLNNTQKTVFKLTDFVVSYNQKIILSIPELTIPKHKLIIISGQSGCGKSTFARCLAGLEEYQGNIYSDYDIQSIFYMTQEAHVFDLTIEQNVALGLPLIPHKMDAVLQQAGIFEQEYQQLTQRGIGENGINISGGQKQRIGIARMLYHNANVMIFDEPTSALDEISTAQVISTLKALSQTITCIVVTHDKRLIEQADIHYQLADHQICQLK